MIAIYRAACAQLLGNIFDTVKYARVALEFLQEGDRPDRFPEEAGAAEALLGLASWASGDLETAYRVFADSMARVQMAGYVSDTLSGTLALADIRIAQGRLHEAIRLYERSLQLTVEQGEPVLRGTADLYVGMSELHREQNDLRTATHLLLKSKQLSEQTGFPYNRSRWCVAMARIQEAQGDLNGALELLHEAERWYVRDFFPNVHPLPALKVRMWVAQGRLGEALSWAREQGLGIAYDLSYLREFEHITLARIFIARYKSDPTGNTILAARGLLERLLKGAEGDGRLGSVLEILVLLALSHQAQGDIRAALMPLQRALALAEPESYVRVFVDEGQPMKVLLEAAAKQGIATNYALQLLAATGETQDETPTKQKMTGPLSERERDVLRLLGTDLSGPNIARELVVSLNTVRTHTQNIYSKLGVRSRRAAVRRAQELHLL